MSDFRIFYNSLGTDQMYGIIRAKAGPHVEVVTLETGVDAERQDKIASCDAVIVASEKLSADLIAAGTALRLIHHQGVAEPFPFMQRNQQP